MAIPQLNTAEAAPLCKSTGAQWSHAEYCSFSASSTGRDMTIAMLTFSVPYTLFDIPSNIILKRVSLAT